MGRESLLTITCTLILDSLENWWKWHAAEWIKAILKEETWPTNVSR